MVRLLTIALGALLLLAGPAKAACAVADIQIKSWTWNRDAGWFRITGELVNTCNEPTGVRLEVTFRDESGRIVSVEDSWAAGQRNIATRATQTFTISTRAYATAKEVSIRVAEIRRWRDS